LSSQDEDVCGQTEEGPICKEMGWDPVGKERAQEQLARALNAVPSI